MRFGRLRIEAREQPEPTEVDYAAGAAAPTPARRVVVGEHRGYRLEAEVVESEGGAPVVVGLTVRRLRRLERKPTRPDEGASEATRRRYLHFLARRREAHRHGSPLFEEPLRPLSLRDLRRLPLATFLEAARAYAGALFAAEREHRATGERVPWSTEELAERLRRVRAPRAVPRRGRAINYPELAKAYRAEVAKGTPNPSAALAHRMGIPPGTMRVYVHRMRRMGLPLDPFAED